MNAPLVSLREAANDSNPGAWDVRTAVEMHVGAVLTRWELTLFPEPQIFDNHGRPVYKVSLSRADIEMSAGDTPEGDPPPEALWGYAALEDLDVVVVRVFGVDPDARIWTKRSRYPKE
jgi:hypothetical protein